MIVERVRLRILDQKVTEGLRDDQVGTVYKSTVLVSQGWSVCYRSKLFYFSSICSNLWRVFVFVPLSFIFFLLLLDINKPHVILHSLTASRSQAVAHPCVLEKFFVTILAHAFALCRA